MQMNIEELKHQYNESKNEDGVLSFDTILNMDVFTDEYIETEERKEAIEELIEETLSHEINESKQLKQLLNIRGFLERKGLEHFKGNKGTDLKRPHISELKASKILMEYVPFILIDEKENPVSMYLFDEGIYTNELSYIHEVISWLEEVFVEAQSKNVIFHIKKKTKVIDIYDGERYSCIGNGILDWKEKKLHPYTPEIVFTSKSSVNYKEFTYEPTFNGWSFSESMKQWAGYDEEVEHLLWQVLRASLQSKNREQFVILIDNGGGRTGKGTFQQFVISLVGKKNLLTLGMADFDKEFYLEGIEKAKIVVGDDNDAGSFLKEPRNLKSLITNDVLNVNPKNRPTYTYQGNPLVIQSANDFVRTSDITDAFKRRMLFAPFTTSFKGEKGDPKIKSEYTYDPNLLSWILYQTVQMDDFTTFIQPEVSQQWLHEFELQNDPVADFYHTVFVELESGRLRKRFVYELFRKWCEEVGRTTNLSERQFTRRFSVFINKSEDWEVSNSTLAIGDYFLENDAILFDKEMVQFNEIDINKYRDDRKPCYVNPANEKRIDVNEIDTTIDKLRKTIRKLESSHSDYKSMDIDETKDKIIDLKERRKKLVAS